MAGIAYYIKDREDELEVVYRYGQSPELLDSELTVDKQTLRPSARSRAVSSLTARVALARIVATFRNRGSWPERGSGFV
jgi:hypothetical protein